MRNPSKRVALKEDDCSPPHFLLLMTNTLFTLIIITANALLIDENENQGFVLSIASITLLMSLQHAIIKEWSLRTGKRSGAVLFFSKVPKLINIVCIPIAFLTQTTRFELLLTQPELNKELVIIS